MRRTVLLWVLCLTAPLLRAQDRAALTGTVTDPTGAVVMSGIVSLHSPVTGLHRETLTNASGIYEFSSLPVGSYDLAIKKDGFRVFETRQIDLLYGQTRTIDAQLQVGNLMDTINVTATADSVNRSNAEVGGVVEAPQIREIPIDGRNWATLMTLAPGAVNTGDGAQRSINFDGHSLDDSNFTFDGIDTSGVQEQTQKADTRLNVSLDSIQEFRVSSAVYTAESGAAGGAQINVVSKSGTNDYHGSVFEYLRNNVLDSRSPFDPTDIPPFRLNQFGAQFGGPIVKNKAFFYANYEGLRQELTNTMIGFVPNAAFRSQVVATSPVLGPIVNAYPVGQTPVDENTDKITVGEKNTTREDSGMFRFDYRFSDKSTAYARYNIDNAYIDNPSDALGTRNVIPHVPQNLVLEYQSIISPALINEVKFGLNRANYHNWTYGTSPISMTTESFDALSDNTLDSEIGTTFSYIDNLTWSRGRNNFKFGVDIRRIRLNNSGNTITDSSIDFATLDDFINNRADDIQVLAGEGIRGDRRTFYMGYAQDELKLTPQLTLNIGLRYEYYSVAHEILNRAAAVDIYGCGGFCPTGTPFYSPNTHDFGPRLGLAWAPAAWHGKTVLRTGYGIYYGGNQNDDFSDPMESAVPRYNVTSDDVPNLSYPINPFIEPQYALYSPKAIDRHRKDLSYQNFSFALEQQLPDSFMGQIAYVGGLGRHLFDKYQVNLIDPTTGQRPLAQFSQFGLKANDANDSFNAMQVSVQRRFVNGFLWQTQYMWSHGIADGSIGSGTSVGFEDMACRVCDRSDSPIDVRHTMTSNAVYQLPFGRGRRYLNSNSLLSNVVGGWQLSGLATASTGRPVNITIKRKAGAMLDGNTSSQRPDLVPGVSIYAANQTIDNWFNPAAFAVPAADTWGDLGRYTARGPGYYEIDTALQKAFPISERFALNFRAEAFNLFNHPIYDSPSGNLSSGGFGQITSILNTGAVGTGTPRRIEFALRLDF
ncbi:MAG TPA: TonB-dependent receptor [Bryobacteraceae bacterium]|nr:TonB-dependent receptor [Bryobacteraceae bacterium]